MAGLGGGWIAFNLILVTAAKPVEKSLVTARYFAHFYQQIGHTPPRPLGRSDPKALLIALSS
ncbi:MAG: hypothetical protein N2C12_12730 [Planctomycetales bacterium]